MATADFLAGLDRMMSMLADDGICDEPDRAVRDQAVMAVLDTTLASTVTSLRGIRPDEIAALPDAIRGKPAVAARAAQLLWLRVFQGITTPGIHDASVVGAWMTANGISAEDQRWQSQTLGLRARSYIQSLDAALAASADCDEAFAWWFYSGQLRAVFRFADLERWTLTARETQELRSDPLTRALGVGARLTRASTGSSMVGDLRATWDEVSASISARYVLINSVFFARPFQEQPDLLLDWSEGLTAASGDPMMDAYGWGADGDGVVLGYRARGLVRKAAQQQDVAAAASLYAAADATVTSALERMPIGDPTTDLALFSEQFERERQSILLFRSATERIESLEEAARKADGMILTTVEIIGLFTAVTGFVFGSVGFLSASGLSVPERLAMIATFGGLMIAFALVIIVAVGRMRINGGLRPGKR